MADMRTGFMATKPEIILVVITELAPRDECPGTTELLKVDLAHTPSRSKNLAETRTGRFVDVTRNIPQGNCIAGGA